MAIAIIFETLLDAKTKYFLGHFSRQRRIVVWRKVLTKWFIWWLRSLTMCLFAFKFSTRLYRVEKVEIEMAKSIRLLITLRRDYARNKFLAISGGREVVALVVSFIKMAGRLRFSFLSRGKEKGADRNVITTKIEWRQWSSDFSPFANTRTSIRLDV